jgi:hypothetical protein
MDEPTYDPNRVIFRLISEYETKPIDWISHGRLAAGKLTDLSGPGGAGKSTMLCDWVARMTRGLPFQDGPARPPAGVVIIANEDDPGDTLRPRLEAAGADLSRVVVLDAESGAIPTLPEGIPDLEEACLGIGAGLLILDPITNMLSSSINHHKDGDVRAALMPLTAMLRRTHVAGVNVRHINKSMSSDPATRVSGSIAFLNVARIGLLLAPDPDSPERVVLAPIKSNLAKWPRSLAFSHESVPGTDVARVTWHGETDTSAAQLLTPMDAEERGQRADAKTWLTEFLMGGMQTQKDVAAAAKQQGISDSTLRRAKTDLGVKSIRINQPGSPIGKFYWSLYGQEAQPGPTAPSQTTKMTKIL